MPENFFRLQHFPLKYQHRAGITGSLNLPSHATVHVNNLKLFRYFFGVEPHVLAEFIANEFARWNLVKKHGFSRLKVSPCRWSVRLQ